MSEVVVASLILFFMGFVVILRLSPNVNHEEVGWIKELVERKSL